MAQGIRTARHMYSGLRIAFEGETRARATSTWLSFAQNSAPPINYSVPFLVADFEDVYERGSDGEWRILSRHIWPNVSGNVIVYGSLSASQALITESALSFLGLGVQPPTPSWGYMVATGIQFYQDWWMSFFPGLAIFLTVLALNFLGDAVRDAFDARLGDRND